MFYDQYPRFLETSDTASGRQRLRIRLNAMIRRNEGLIRGKRVLDLASHDGRWSFAALKKAGAAHVIGVEGNPELVENANDTFQEYGVDPDTYRFISADLFDVLADPAAHDIDVDVVLCLGFLYHTLRYSELLNGMRRMNPEVLILDTAVHPGEGQFIRLFNEDTGKESASVDSASHGYEARMLTGRPTQEALDTMLRVHGFEVAEKLDWPAYIEEHYPKAGGVPQYRDGRRVTWTCRPV